MNLHEYQTKKLLSEYKLPIPKGYVCKSMLEIENILSIIEIKSKSLVLKCQIQAGGRGKSGGIKLVKSKKEIIDFARKWLGNYLVTYQTDKSGLIVNSILIEESINFTEEIYLAITIDRSKCKVVFLASKKGGIEVENFAKISPNSLSKSVIDPIVGFQPYQGRKLAFDLGLHKDQINKFNKILMGLANLFFEKDLSLIEINPLVINDKKDFICLDGKAIVDDNALFRQCKMSKMRDYNQEDNLETQARKFNMSYVSLENGNIGCMVNGAGLAMATLDIIKLYGGSPANFLDIGGNSNKEHVIEAMKLILKNEKIKVILINIFGGIVRCDSVAKGIIEVVNQINIKIPIIIRLDGNSSQLGIDLIKKSKVDVFITRNLIFAVKKTMSIIRKTTCLF